MKSLSDISRLQVLNAVMDKPQYVEELANRVDLAVSTVSFHLKKLEKAGLVNSEKEQYYTVYSLNNELFNLSLRELVTIDNIEKYIQDERVEKYRQKVIKTFFKKKRLIKLPVQRKKKLIVLNEFLRLFEMNRMYTETEIDEMINTLYDDHCTIRRMLVDEGVMNRNNQTYKLVKDKLKEI
ncbi:MAG: metalloregulator ArsR/SmtB family transcription factor [Spirochaetes bacterium]|nr:metalloregulator ArsR/SmtB family transcription factor [Spirochaetota bacterium]